MMAARLKVFVTSDGLTDYVVATSSRAKALAAWGVNQDLFKEGRAHEAKDEALRAEATGRPGEVLRRPAGSRAALARLKPVKRPRPKAPSKAALQRVTALEGQIAALDAKAAAIEARLSEEIAALTRKARARRDGLSARRRKLADDLRRARRAAADPAS
jgi:hypothetical protein